MAPDEAAEELEVCVSGTIPDTNAPLNEANEAFYSAVVSEKIRREFAAIDTHIPTSACPADVKRVRDVSTGENVINGVMPFFIQGVELTQGGDGEKVELFDKDGTTKICDVTVLDATSKISLKAKLDEVIESGRYYLMVTTLAGGESTLYPIGICATVVNHAPVPLKIRKVTSTKLERDDAVKLWSDEVVAELSEVPEDATGGIRLVMNSTNEVVGEIQTDSRNKFERLDDKHVKITVTANSTDATDGQWNDHVNYRSEFYLKSATRGEVFRPIELA